MKNKYSHVHALESKEKAICQKHLPNGNGFYLVQLLVLCYTSHQDSYLKSHGSPLQSGS